MLGIGSPGDFVNNEQQVVVGRSNLLESAIRHIVGDERTADGRSDYRLAT